MKKIPAGPKYFALVDDEDYEYLSQFTWSYLKSGYAFRRTWDGKNKKSTCYYMHREVARTPIDMDTDHINHNGLDNRKENLRVCTTAQNLANRGFLPTRNKSGYRGVSFDGKKWVAQIGRRSSPKEHTNLLIGRFTTPEEAAKAYDKVLHERFGEFAKLNFEIGG